MERSPGKQLFIDDSFIESLDGARRVLNQPQKLTVDEPLSIPFDKPWETQLAQPGRVIYDERERLFRMYYRAWTGEQTLLCALDSSDGLNWERPELGLFEFDGSTRNNITNAHAQHLSLIRDPYEQNETHRWKQIDNQPTRVDESGAPRWQAHFSHDGYNWHPYPEDRHSQQKMIFNFGSPAETFGGVIDPDAPYLHYSQRGSNRRTRGPGTTRQPGLPQLVRPAPGVLTTHRFRQEQGGQMRVNVDASAGELRYEMLEDTGRPIPGCTTADCDPIRADTLDGQLSWNGKPGWPPVSQDRMSRYPQLAQSEYYAKLRFYIAPGAKLYSLTIDPPDVTVWRVKFKSRLD